MFFYMLYAATAVLYAVACVYLLFRRGNAFSTTVTTSVRLRRWTAAAFAAALLSHLWYMPLAFLTVPADITRAFLAAGLLDSMTVLPLDIVVLLCMLQDRRRPLWVPFVVVLPLAAMLAVSIVRCDFALRPLWLGYLLLAGVGLMAYMIRATRQYGHWLHDNYADLEHKEVWANLVMLVIFLLFYTIYLGDLYIPGYNYIIHVYAIGVICYLLWRVETLSDLSVTRPLVADRPAVQAPACSGPTATPPSSPADEALKANDDSIAQLLQERCVDTGLYLHHDLTLVQLAKEVGINRYYLSQYFSRKGITYNAYINGLRIDQFIRLYHEAVANQRDFTIKSLADASGYQSYSTFSLAFKQLVGQNVSAWQREAAGGAEQSEQSEHSERSE